MPPVTGPYSTAPGRRRKVGNIEVWAEDGLVFAEWQDRASSAADVGNVEMLDVPSAKRHLERIVAELDVWDKKREDSSDPVDRAYAIDYYHTLRGWLEGFREVIKDAEDQGDQTDPAVRRSRLVQFLRSRRANLAGTNLDTLASPTLIFNGIQGPLVFGPHSQAPTARRSKPVVVSAPEMPQAWLRKGA